MLSNEEQFRAIIEQLRQKQILFFEDWLDEFRQLASGLLDVDAAFPRIKLASLAHYCGVRWAKGVLEQAWLNGVTNFEELSQHGWFNTAIAYCEAGQPHKAAEIFVAHGWTKAFCCGGLQLDCKLHQAIRAVICRRN